ncbi:MAG: 2-phosphosulfolactate phosphatase [Desulfovibrio sp.]|nr:MAG: 2-phosphosulfolactate phosphatase [Desulfovibrio sp.]
MSIRLLQGFDGARSATGLAVIIDVFRAFTTGLYAVRQGAKEIWAVADLDLAYQLKRENPGAVLMGERGGEMPPGFDFGNSPADIETEDFSGKTVIHTTCAGTPGVVAAMANPQVEEVIAASLANSTAVAEYLRGRVPELGTPTASIVAMGSSGETPSEEDEACARRLHDLLLGQEPEPMTRVAQRLRTIPSAHKFFDPDKPWAPERDFTLCVNADLFHFVLRAEKASKTHVVLRPFPL